MSVFGNNLRAFCVLRNQTRANIAEAAHVAVQTPTRWIQQDRKPHDNIIRILSESYGEDPARFTQDPDGFAAELVERMMLVQWDTTRCGLSIGAWALEDIDVLHRMLDNTWQGVIPRSRASVPLLSRDVLRGGPLPTTLPQLSVPREVLENTPHVFAVQMLVDDHGRPAKDEKMYVLVDYTQDPDDHIALVVNDELGRVMVRHVNIGNSSVFLTAVRSPVLQVLSGQEDLVYPLEHTRILGRVVAHQGWSRE